MGEGKGSVGRRGDQSSCLYAHWKGRGGGEGGRRECVVGMAIKVQASVFTLLMGGLGG